MVSPIEMKYLKRSVANINRPRMYNEIIGEIKAEKLIIEAIKEK